MLVIPLSFLTEHIETLHEINIEARERAESLGVSDFHMMPALNDSPLSDSSAGGSGAAIGWQALWRGIIGNVTIRPGSSS